MASKSRASVIDNSGETDFNKSDKTAATKNDVNNITVKVAAMGHFVAYYLDLIEFVSAVDDEEFSRRFHDLRNYVYGKIGLPTDAGDIVGEYVVYEIES